MHRSSPFLIRLSSAEAAELNRRAAKYTLPYLQVQRAKMILMAAEGLSNDEIALRLDTSRDVVSIWRKRFFTEAPWRVWKNAHVRADPGLFPPELVVQVKAWACELPATHEVPLSRWSTSFCNHKIRRRIYETDD